MCDEVAVDAGLHYALTSRRVDHRGHIQRVPAGRPVLATASATMEVAVAIAVVTAGILGTTSTRVHGTVGVAAAVAAAPHTIASATGVDAAAAFADARSRADGVARARSGGRVRGRAAAREAAPRAVGPYGERVHVRLALGPRRRLAVRAQ